MTILSTAEIADACAGLKQDAAQVRFLKSLGLRVERKPNGAPLVNRAHFDLVTSRRQASTETVGTDGPKWGVH